jgi:hypothetical protein
MPRKHGATTEKNCYCCEVSINDTLLMPMREFKTLKDIAEDLGMTYNQIADISCGRVVKKYKFKFMPSIVIHKLES